MNNSNSTGSLVLEQVAKIFPQRGSAGMVTAVDHVSLNIRQGEFVTLLGPSGCGKTTTLRLIAGFEAPTHGRILLDERDITAQPPNKRDMAMVFQSYALFPHMSVFDNVAYGLQTHHVPAGTIRTKVNDALDVMSLTGLGDRRPNQLSGGQQQRVALARCLVMEPRVLLFDEPLSNLDAKLRVAMRSEIRALQRRLNITSVYVTHDQVEAMAMSDRIVVMNAGRIEQIGSPEEIYRRPATRFVADFIGRANFIETCAEAITGDHVVVPLLGQKVSVPVNPAIKVGDRLTAVVRPEALILTPDPALTQVAVEQAMYLGTAVDYVVRSDDHTLIVVDADPRASRIFTEGQTVGLDFIAEAIHLLPLSN
ncbi:MAG: ABC transporter ATP-binding protein [Anaerolineae bacterium]|nr:ABC transporter ATP-binding protein [Anaerolineae bacterium]